ncbi:MAG: hypothetical protein B6I20_10025 [Bacteroidetes bacterium 4572_117]|nr:MAG: hypothetical protein B6I20_10025 [Bacteroidetes bacterium 4572_117]
MNKIICPKCQAVLNPQNNVILSALKKDGEWGLILLSAKLGDYSVNNHESFVIAEGDAVKFYCPACHINLSDFAPNKHLAGIELIDVDKTKKTIFISSVAGENLF